MEKPDVVFKLKSQASMPYRVYYMSKDGIQLGGTSIEGKFPWKSSQKVARRILRAWARDLVSGHDEAQLSAILQKWAKDWIGHTGDGPFVDKPSIPKYIINQLREKTNERKALFTKQNNERDASIMFHLSEEMIKAVNYCLMREGIRLRIRWEVESLPNGAGIYRILLEGGKNLEG